MADFDTLESICELARSPVFLNELLFHKLRSYVGTLVRGVTSHIFSSECWGPGVELFSGETLHLRVWPRGLFEAAAAARPTPSGAGGPGLDEMPDTVIIASRRLAADADASAVATCFVILWKPSVTPSRVPASFLTVQRGALRTTGSRNLHAFCPALINHHVPRPGDGSPWPLLDEANFHALCSASFSVYRAAEDSLIHTAAGGVSQFVIAGQLIGTEVEDAVHRRAQPIAHGQWCALCGKYAGRIEECAPSSADALRATCSSMAITDLLSLQGLVGLLGHPLLDGALPADMHLPAGLPLLIAFACRLACYPQRFGIEAPTKEDAWTNLQVAALFEAEWPCLDGAEDEGLRAVDVIIRAALTEANHHGKREKVTRTIEDNLIFWRRAGQRCIASLFGPTEETFSPPRSSLGAPELLGCPLQAARERVLRSAFSEDHTVASPDVDMLAGSAPDLDRGAKQMLLLRALQSVEGWLRTGTYAGLQVNRRNDAQPQPPSTPHRKGRKERKARTITKKEFMTSLHGGMEASARHLIATGSVINDEVAREASEIINSGVQELLAGLPDEEIIVAESEASDSTSSSRSASPPAPAPAPAHLCLDAAKNATSCIAAALCQGGSVSLQLGATPFLAHETAEMLCADCPNAVHVLELGFLETTYSSCHGCHAIRCITCSQREAHRVLQLQKPPLRCCLRCAEPAEAETAAPPPPKAPPGGKKKGKKKG